MQTSLTALCCLCSPCLDPSCCINTQSFWKWKCFMPHAGRDLPDRSKSADRSIRRTRLTPLHFFFLFLEVTRSAAEIKNQIFLLLFFVFFSACRWHAIHKLCKHCWYHAHTLRPHKGEVICVCGLILITELDKCGENIESQLWEPSREQTQTNHTCYVHSQYNNSLTQLCAGWWGMKLLDHIWGYICTPTTPWVDPLNPPLSATSCYPANWDHRLTQPWWTHTPSAHSGWWLELLPSQECFYISNVWIIWTTVLPHEHLKQTSSQLYCHAICSQSATDLKTDSSGFVKVVKCSM